MATQYQVAVDAIQAKDKQAQAKVKALGNSTYHTLAAFELARSQVDAGQNEAAIATLRSIKSDDAAIAEIVNQRLARLLIETKQAQAALKLVANAEQPVGDRGAR